MHPIDPDAEPRTTIDPQPTTGHLRAGNAVKPVVQIDRLAASEIRTIAERTAPSPPPVLIPSTPRFTRILRGHGDFWQADTKLPQCDTDHKSGRVADRKSCRARLEADLAHRNGHRAVRFDAGDGDAAGVRERGVRARRKLDARIRQRAASAVPDFNPDLPGRALRLGVLYHDRCETESCDRARRSGHQPTETPASKRENHV